MTKREYAEKIAELIDNAEVMEVEKPNGIKLIGISIKDGSNIVPNIYIDSMFDSKVSVKDAVEKVKTLTENNKASFDMSMFEDYKKAKKMLRARVFNAKTNHVEVFKSASEYGYDDLIIAPYISDIKLGNDQIGSAKVSKALAESWGLTEDEVIDEAIKNSKADFIIEDMLEIMARKMGITVDELSNYVPTEGPKMYVVSSKDLAYGSIAAVLNGNKLKKKFPNGYSVIPSSVHEVLVVPADNGLTEGELNCLVGSVNETEVTPEEVLSDHIYTFR